MKQIFSYYDIQHITKYTTQSYRAGGDRKIKLNAKAFAK